MVQFILLHMAVHFFPTPFIEETIFSTLYILGESVLKVLINRNITENSFSHSVITLNEIELLSHFFREEDSGPVF